MIPKKQTHRLEIYVGHPSLQAAMIYTLHAQWIYEPWLLEGWLEHTRQQVAVTIKCHNARSLCIKVGQLVAATRDLSLQHGAATFCLVRTDLKYKGAQHSCTCSVLLPIIPHPCFACHLEGMGQCSPLPFFMLIYLFGPFPQIECLEQATEKHVKSESSQGCVRVTPVPPPSTQPCFCFY